MTEGAASSRLGDRYGVVGLHRNPFAVADHGGERAGAVFVDRGVPRPPPPGAMTVVQVLGDQGAGKTTHVMHWRAAAAGPYHYFPKRPYTQRWRRPPVETLVYGDEIDRMPRPLRWWWFRQLARVEATVVIGTHVDLSRLAMRTGFAAQAHVLDRVDIDTFGAIVERRLEVDAIAGRPRFHFTDADIESVHAKSQGRLRVAEGLLHELLAERVR